MQKKIDQHKRPGVCGLFPGILWLWLVVPLGLGVVWAIPSPYILRFSDTPFLHRPSSTGALTLSMPTSAEPDSPMTPAKDWLKRHRWKRVWPLMSFGNRQQLHFAGPSTQRYLRIDADNTFNIWARRLEIDPYHTPSLVITWGVERFPRGAALDVYGRNDRALVVTISFGQKVPSPGLLPDLPRALAFFWGATETVGDSYTCITPREGPDDVRMQCKYPHIKYIALRSGEAGSVHTDRVNMLEYFQRYFPDYWQKHQRVPPVVGVGFESRSDKTDSVSQARLYTIAFATNASSDEPVSGSGRDGK
jgi:hypothetical protein